jgi:osmoprotectant transport system permease protein
MDLELARIGHATVQHLWLTGVSMSIAVVLGVPLGAWLSRERAWAGGVLAAVGIVQTVPSLALLGLLVPLMHAVGDKPALVALFLYALLPIVRNTYTGLVQVDPAAIDAARGMGMTPRQILIEVSLPQALPHIMAGIRTSTVINVGVATLAALVGAGGLGDLILAGLTMVDARTILMGAIPAALLALVLDGSLAVCERVMTPVGLRKESSGPRPK